MLAIAAGLSVFIGVLMGMLGGGGSVLMVPILLYVLKLDPKAALLTSQLIMAATSSVALLVHARAGRVAWTTGVLFGSLAMVGAYLGGSASHYVPARLLILGFTALMLLSAVQLLRARRPPPSPPGAVAEPTTTGLIPWRSLLVGLPTGFVAGILGAGGGFLVVPVLTLLGGLSIQQAVGTSLLVIAMQSTAGAAGYLAHEAAAWRVVVVLAATMSVSSIFGGLLSQRLPAALLRRLFAGLLIVATLFMLVRNLW
jgi:uncharacterized membrane protein YfcA